MSQRSARSARRSVSNGRGGASDGSVQSTWNASTAYSPAGIATRSDSAGVSPSRCSAGPVAASAPRSMPTATSVPTGTLRYPDAGCDARAASAASGGSSTYTRRTTASSPPRRFAYRAAFPTRTSRIISITPAVRPRVSRCSTAAGSSTSTRSSIDLAHSVNRMATPPQRG
jgi:hypothetical protein